MSAGQLARQRSLSNGAPRPPMRTTTPLLVGAPSTVFESDGGALQPCAATASIFLYAQGKSIVCLHHDSLAVERRFEKHKQQVVLLEVDNVSERGAGRLVMSYDEEQTAIVWDLFTGDEITRFASFDPLRVAAWMKNGNVAFGNSKGHVMLFEPSTSEHRSSRTINDPITSIAPAADCQTYAIGYNNGSILIASLLPNFTILHTLSTSGAPSPVVSIAWHASSSKQKSDMLAVQNGNGDLRVWSVSKPPGGESPKVIRVLKRGDAVEEGLNWISWSKNGRIIQFSQGETWSWDVRTKHVAYEPVPTVEGVQGVANHGPGAVLFTLGPNNSVQQYELGGPNPPSMTKNIRHESSRPSSVQSTPKVKHNRIPGAAPPIPAYKSIDPPRSGAASLSTIQRATQEMSAIDHARQMRNGMGSPMSSTSRTDTIDSRSSAGRQYGAPSVSSRAPSGTTFSTLSPSIVGRESTASGFWPATASVSVASSGRRSKSSRLRNEVLNSPEGNIVDLFPYTRARLASLPYAPQPAAMDPNTAPADELRKQMLEIVFGWDGDIEPMIRDEMARHPPGSMNATLLSKWLGEVNMDMMSMMNPESVSQNDWMLLALSTMSGNGAAGQQMGRTFAHRLIAQGDIHTAATIYIGIHDFDEAIDIYVSRNYYMEGILLTCLLFPEEWQRQAQLVRRWGEYVVENSQQHLAIRCFTVTGTDTSLPWASPTASPFQGGQPGQQLPQTLSPPTSPPPDQKPQRKTAKNSALKLITTFGPQEKGFKFPGLKTDDRTPTNAPGVTPIAESALSPGGTPSTYLRPSRAKTPGGHSRHKLPSIGETPIDVNPPQFPIVVKPAKEAATDGSGSEVEKDSGLPQGQDQEPPKMIEDPPLTLSSARYDPKEKEEKTPHATPQTAIPNSAVRKSIFSNSEVNSMNNAQERSRTRNGSRDRKPNGLHIQMPSLSQLNLNAIATGSNVASPLSRRKSNTSSSLHSGSSASGKFDLRYDTASPPVTGQSWASSAKSPSVSGRSIDPYISSLEEAQFYAQKKKHRSHRSREGRSEHKSRSKGRHRQPSEERGRAGQRYIRPAKRSPSSPVPMSPDDLQQYRDAHSQSIDSVATGDSSPEAAPRPLSTRRKGASKVRSASKFSEQSQRTTVRHHSPESRQGEERSRHASRRQSPLGFLSPIDGRGRSKSRQGGSIVRSPSSPLPMSPQAALYQYEADENDNGPLRLVEANRNRMRSKQRSSSRKPAEREKSSRREREPSMDRRRDASVGRQRDHSVDRRRERSLGRLNMIPEPLHPSRQEASNELRDSPKSSDFEKGGSDSQANPRLQRHKSHRSIKKEMAARELEARRESLTARTMAAVAKPTSMYYRPSLSARSQSDLSGIYPSPSPHEWRSPDSLSGGWSGPSSSDFIAPPPPERTSSAGPMGVGLPATPRAMRHPRYARDDADSIPAVPELPDAFYATGQPKWEPSRSMSAPVPEPDVSISMAPPTDMPLHPAFHRNVRPSTKRPNFSPLNEIGRQRRSPSIDAGVPPVLVSPPVLASIHEALDSGDAPVIDVPVSSNTPPAVIPELQHLAGIPPPPPPPPPMVFNDPAHHSLSSGSGVGTINIVMDDDQDQIPPPPPPPPAKDAVASPPLPPLPSPGKGSPPLSGNSMKSAQQQQQPPVPPPPPAHPGSPPVPSIPGQNGNGMHSAGHRRGRSIDHIGNKIARVADRMRSSSRGRQAQGRREVGGPSPYETKVETVGGGGSYF